MPDKKNQKILIAGSGICGLCSAMALARTGRQIILFDQDSAPPEGDADQAFQQWDRRGAAQFRHPHAFLGLMCNVIKDNYPDLLEQFYEAGARRVGFEEMIPHEFLEHYSPVAGDERLWILMCRRATIETVMRHYVTSLAGVEIVNNATVTGLLSHQNNGVPEVDGYQVLINGETLEFFGDIIVDASGRTSKIKKWVEQLAVVTIEEEKTDADIVYYTRHYRLKPGQSEPIRGENAGSAWYL